MRYSMQLGIYWLLVFVSWSPFGMPMALNSEFIAHPLEQECIPSIRQSLMWKIKMWMKHVWIWQSFLHWYVVLFLDWNYAVACFLFRCTWSQDLFGFFASFSLLLAHLKGNALFMQWSISVWLGSECSSLGLQTHQSKFVGTSRRWVGAIVWRAHRSLF